MSVSEERAPGTEIAVVGMSCRFPGAPSPAAFWQLLRCGRDAITQVPAGRWDTETVLRGELPETDRANIRRGGFLDDVDCFDAEFFGIAPREAAAMDPQQRLVLELTWEALEDAGINPETVRGSQAGVFIGAIRSDYALLAAQSGPGGITQYTGTGSYQSMIANRLSYVFGFHGPSLLLDAAQSSSLVAVHMAGESLRRGESVLAVAGGVNLNIVPESAVSASRSGALSPDGRCHTFDARANGYARGEGGGVVVLRPLHRALADGDRIHCVIRATAVNNDGGGDGLTVPSQAAQEQLLRLACERAGIDPRDLQYVELHGTGTRVGDPIEAAALGSVVGCSRPADSPLRVGSVKTNIGHLEGAAGVAGLIKTALCIEHGEIPPSLNFETPSPRIALDKLNLSVQRALGPWPEAARPFLAGVSSFGMGGTNCHVIVAEPPPADRGAGTASARPQSRAPMAPPEPVPCLVSARSAEGLRAQAERLREHVAGHPDLSTGDVAYSLATTRAGLEHRAVVLASDREEFLAGLAATARGEAAANVVNGVAATDGRVGFLFAGQGSQRAGMGQALYASFPVFAAAFDEVCAGLDAHLDRPIREVIFAEAGSADAALLDQTAFTQPALFALEIGVFRLLESWGVVADAVMGHSVGELAAAHAAGALPLADACALVAARGRLMQRLPAGGAMASVQAADAEVAAELAGIADRVSIAAVNGPEQVVISGDEDAVVALADSWRARGRKTRRLRVSHAFHSPRMEPMLSKFGQVVAGLSVAQPVTPLVSNVTGQLVSGQLREPGYWVRHAREPVRFLAGMHSLAELGVTTFIEVGPDGALSVMARGCLPPDRADLAFVPLLRADRPDVQALVSALARAHAHGVNVDWRAFFAGSDARRVDLPTYAFQRQRYWVDAAAVPGGPAGPSQSAGNGTEASARPEPGGGEVTGQPLRSPAAGQLAGLPAAEQERLLLELVRGETALVLGHPAVDAVDARRTFKDLGFNSLSAVELRDRLTVATGLALPDTVVFDYPVPAVLVQYLREQLTGEEERGSVRAVHLELAKLEESLSGISPDNADRAAITTRLEGLLRAWRGARDANKAAAADDDIQAATDDEMIEIINRELGRR
jgi:acyl transferase domain-containing protein